MRASKSKHIAAILAERIKRGAYSSFLPGAPSLAKEFGVTPVTIYNALDVLKSTGVAVQQENGRLVPVSTIGKHQLRVTYLAPSGVYPFDRWPSAVRDCAVEFGCDLKTVIYQYPDDSVVFNTLNNGDFDVIFVHGYSSMISNPLLASILHSISDKVVSLFYDDTANGVRLLDGYEDNAMEILIKYLKRNNCGRIGFFYSSSPHSKSRVYTAVSMLKKYSLLGDCKNVELPSGMHSARASAAIMSELLSQGVYENDDVIYCGTVDMAIGASLALRMSGRRIPEDVSLVSFGNPELAALQNPPLTVVATPDPRPQVSEILKQYLGISENAGCLRFTGTIPENNPESILFIGQSVKFNTEK